MQKNGGGNFMPKKPKNKMYSECEYEEVFNEEMNVELLDTDVLSSQELQVLENYINTKGEVKSKPVYDYSDTEPMEYWITRGY